MTTLTTIVLIAAVILAGIIVFGDRWRERR